MAVAPLSESMRLVTPANGSSFITTYSPDGRVPPRAGSSRQTTSGDVIALMRMNYDRSARAAGATATNPSPMKQKKASTPIT